jgi:subtilisin family serine protease
MGLVDSGLDASHSVFSTATLHRWGCADRAVPDAHGTAVASILVSHVGETDLWAADVYCGSPTGGDIDTIVAALSWMCQHDVRVINMSLVGPKNIMLQRAIAALIARGTIVVAAVGNDGPSAAPLYPAAYVGVVGVTAVDIHHRVLIEALRGPQVMFAALGDGVSAANLKHGSSAVRGTSFAAPIVAALLARETSRSGSNAAADPISSLAKRALDLGPPGRDLIYGIGYVE